MFRFFTKAQGSRAPIDFRHPDAVVTVTNSRHSKNPFGKNYRGCCAIKEGYLTALAFQTTDGSDMLYAQPKRCYVNFIAPKVYPHTLWVGRKLALYEGERYVGEMVVEEIRNAKLDRNIKFQDRPNILQNGKVLNLALKRALAWGKKLDMPLDNQLMKSLPTLSGTDIDKVSEYVIHVRDDVLWEIYYPNWDAKEETWKTDVDPVVTTKYPWIDKDNLAALAAQGMYYAWHG